MTSAREFAIRHHRDQKYGDQPYVVHLDAVAKNAEPYGEQAQTVAYLHDILEDTSCSFEELEAAFGRDVANAVQLLTDEPGTNRKERKLKTNKKLRETSNSLALLVKACDRLANARASQAHPEKLNMYSREYAEFKASVHRPGLCDEIWSELDSIFAAKPTPETLNAYCHPPFRISENEFQEYLNELRSRDSDDPSANMQKLARELGANPTLMNKWVDAFFANLEIAEKKELHLEKGSFNAQIEGSKILVPTQVFEFATRNQVWSGRALASYTRAFPAALSSTFGWTLAEVDQARIALEELLGIDPTAEQPKVRRSYGALPPRGKGPKSTSS